MSYLRFRPNGTSASGLTRRWVVENVQTDSQLGWIEWKASWRKYWFCPLNGTGYDSVCMGEIGNFLATETQFQKDS